MPSIFTRIVRGEIPSHRVYEDDEHYAFLDINPAQRGHTILIPKREVDYLFDLEPDEHTEIWRVAHELANALKAATGCTRVVVLVLGYEIPHAHIHLIPTNQLGDFPMPPQSALDPADVDGLLASIRAAL